MAWAHPPQLYPDHFYWAMEMQWTLANGQNIEGINRELFTQHAELREPMVQFLQMFETPPDASNETGDGCDIAVDMHGFGSEYQSSGIHLDTNAAISDAIVPAPASILAPAPAPAPAIQSPVPEPSAYAQIKTESSPPPPVSAQRLPTIEAPDYLGDFANANDARTYLAHPDPEDCQALHIPGDDFAAVQATQQHYFAKLLLEAITTPGLMDPPALQHGEKESALKKFRGQQQATMSKIVNELRTPAQRRQASAHCLLTVDAAIFVSRYGIPKQLYQAALTNSNNVRTKRKARADVTSKCSKRLETMVSIVRDYKLVAHDILTGKNTHRFAQDPGFYAEEKIMYLTSNLQRQETAEAIQAAKPELGMRTAKRKHAADDGEEAKDVKRPRW